jgi:hypothetical protein
VTGDFNDDPDETRCDALVPGEVNTGPHVPPRTWQSAPRDGQLVAIYQDDCIAIVQFVDGRWRLVQNLLGDWVGEANLNPEKYVRIFPRVGKDTNGAYVWRGPA